ncbi:MAG: hypothetical protein M5R36_24525 [Deltaproteobacteria bacterium]|nr:hypothetical protein [Deltaproteobacteria bacterium]
MVGNTRERLWGMTTGLLVGAGVGGHALRLVVLGMSGIGARHAVAGFAVLLYGTAAALTFMQRKAGLWIAVLGPLGGVTAVTLAPGASIDTFQVVLGVFQFLALGLSLYLLFGRPADVS